MINKEIFWRIINKNKANPIDFYHDAENLSLNEVCQFYILLNEYSKRLNEDFLMDMCIDYKLVNFVEDKIDDTTSRYIFGSAYDYIAINIIFRGEDLYNSFLNEDELKIKSILKNMNGQLSDGDVAESMMFKIGIIKVATDEELDRLDDMNVYDECIDRFFDEVSKVELTL